MEYTEHTQASFNAAKRDHEYFHGYMAERASKYAHWLDEVYNDSDHDMRFIIDQEKNNLRIINPDTWFDMPLNLMWEPSHNFINALFLLKKKKDKAIEDFNEAQRLDREKREYESYLELHKKYGSRA